ncbi:MAG: hypothetical protein RMH75_07065 [Archaeoglobaceae archaeon]|nr:hypothetical protein [Archaeoglobaceae archaeon]MDW7990400.1 hypothetical protein [Archaeoglobaceae archaeon]
MDQINHINLLEYLYKCKEVVERMEIFSRESAELYVKIAKALLLLGKREEGEEIIKKLEDLKEKLEEHDSIEIMIELAYLYRYIGMEEKFRLQLEKATKETMKVRDEYTRSILLHKISKIFTEENPERAIKSAEKIPDEAQKIFALSDLYSSGLKTEKTLKAKLSELKMYLDAPNCSLNYYALSEIQKLISENTVLHDYYMKELPIIKKRIEKRLKNASPDVLAEALVYKSRELLLEGKKNEAQGAIEKALDEIKKIENPFLKAMRSIEAAKVLSEMGKDLTELLKNVEENLQIVSSPIEKAEGYISMIPLIENEDIVFEVLDEVYLIANSLDLTNRVQILKRVAEVQIEKKKLVDFKETMDKIIEVVKECSQEEAQDLINAPLDLILKVASTIPVSSHIDPGLD